MKVIRKVWNLRVWSAITGVALVVALVLTFLPMQVSIDTGGLLSISLSPSRAQAQEPSQPSIKPGFGWKPIGFSTYTGGFTAGQIYNVTCPSNINSGSGVAFSYSNYTLTYHLSSGKMQWTDATGDKTKAIGAVLSSVGAIQPDGEHNKIAYANAFLNTAVEYRAYSVGVKEVFVLSELPYNDGKIADSYLEYTGELTWDSGLSVWVDGVEYPDKTFNTSSSVDFKDVTTNQTVFSFLAPVAWDSAGSRCNAVYDVKVSADKVQYGLRVPYSWLQTAVFPVTIDPSFTARTETYVDLLSLSTPYNITVTKPTGTADGDILFCCICSSGSAVIDSMPSGWELLGSYTASNYDKHYLYYKIAADEGTSWVWSFSLSCQVRAVCSCYTGGDFDPADPIDVVSDTPYTTDDTSCIAASMTVSVANSPLVFWAGAYRTLAMTFTKPSVPTTDWVEDDDAGSTTSDLWIEVCSMIWSGLGATGNMDAIMSSSSSYKHAFAVALNPAAAGVEIPTVATQAATDVLSTSCTGNGNITATGGANAHTRGFCYMVGISGDPTTSDSKVYDNGAGSYGTGAYSKSITGLTPSTGYRVRAYAINSAGTGYGSTVQVTTANPDWLTGWSYRKSHVINNATGAGTNYQKQITVHYYGVDAWVADAPSRTYWESSVKKVGSYSCRIDTTTADQLGSLIASNGVNFASIPTGTGLKLHCWARVTNIGTQSCGSGYPALGSVSGATGYIHALGFHGDGVARTLGQFRYTHAGTATTIFPNHSNDNTGNPGHIDDYVGVFHANAWYEFEITFDLANSQQYTKVRGDGETNWRDLGDIDLKTTAGESVTSSSLLTAFFTKASSDTPANSYYVDDYQAYTYAGGTEIFDTGFENGILVGDFFSIDSDDDVYLEAKCRTDFGDVRFTDDDGSTLLSCWMESKTDSDNAVFWVKVADSLESAPQTIYTYCGKADATYPYLATDQAHGVATFLFFDNFERGVNGDEVGGVWTEVAGSCEISTDHAYGGTRCAKAKGLGGGAGISAPYTAGTGYAIRLRGWKEDATIDTDWVLHGNGAKAIYFFSEADEDVMYYDTAKRDTGYDSSKDAWDLYEINNFNWSAGTYDIWLNGVKIKSAAVMYGTTSWANVLLPYCTSVTSGNDAYWDDILVRKFVDPEPTHGAWGEWETVNPEITNTPSSWAVGILEVNTTSNTAINYFTITNTGNCTVDVTIQGTNMIGGGYTWTISGTATPGNMIYGLKAGLDDADDLFDVVVNSTANAFISDLPESATQAWGLKIWAPTSYDDGNLKTGNVTLTAVAG